MNTPSLAVTIPIESTFVTSSYVNAPETPRLPVIVTPVADACAFTAPPNLSADASIPDKFDPSPENYESFIIPDATTVSNTA